MDFWVSDGRQSLNLFLDIQLKLGVYWSDNIGRIEKRMETTIVYWGYIGNNGKEHGNYYNPLRVLWNWLRCAASTFLFSMDFG